MAVRRENVRALARGLKVLRFLNSAGAARASEISAALDIPRPTVYRLLRTLEEEGYVLFSSTDARARVSALAAALGDNSAARSRLCHVAGPFLSKFTDEYSWPVDLSVYEDAHMVIQETTHGRSPLSVDNNMVGFALPMLRSSAGRAYLAACDARECEIILDLLRNKGLLEDQPFLLKRWLDENLTMYAKQGFATRSPRTFRPKTSSLSVPIYQEERVVGCLSIIWIAKAVTMVDAAEQYLNPLKQLATEIREELAEPAV